MIERIRARSGIGRRSVRKASVPGRLRVAGCLDPAGLRAAGRKRKLWMSRHASASVSCRDNVRPPVGLPTLHACVCDYSRQRQAMSSRPIQRAVHTPVSLVHRSLFIQFCGKYQVDFQEDIQESRYIWQNSRGWTLACYCSQVQSGLFIQPQRRGTCSVAPDCRRPFVAGQA